MSKGEDNPYGENYDHMTINEQTESPTARTYKEDEDEIDEKMLD